MNGRTRLLVGLTMALAVVAIVYFTLTSGSAERDPPEPSRSGVQQESTVSSTPERPARSAAASASDVPTRVATRPQEGSLPGAHKTDPERRVVRSPGGPPPPSSREQTATNDSVIQLPGQTRAGWDDPTNDRVLGPKDWMAVADPEERARIDEVFDDSRAARHDPRLSHRERGQSVAAMKAVVDSCFAALRERLPTASGRLIVAWTAGAKGGEGTITNPRIKVNYKLEDELFEACVLDGAQNLRFVATDGESIEVEAPFFYDGAF